MLLGRTLAELMKPVGPLGLPVEEFIDSSASVPGSLGIYSSGGTGASSSSRHSEGEGPAEQPVLAAVVKGGRTVAGTLHH